MNTHNIEFGFWYCRYAVILAFDVKVTNDAKQYAAEHGVRIFTAEIIYHLFDQFTEYMEGIKSREMASVSSHVVFPVVLSILPNCIFNMKNPIIIGVTVEDGILRVGTPLVVAGRVVCESPYLPLSIAITEPLSHPSFDVGYECWSCGKHSCERQGRRRGQER